MRVRPGDIRRLCGSRRSKFSSRYLSGSGVLDRRGGNGPSAKRTADLLAAV